MPMDELLDCPIWWNGKDIVEAAFCEEFTRPIISSLMIAAPSLHRRDT